MSTILTRGALRNSLPLFGELVGSDTRTCAGMTAVGNAPVLAMCRQLLAAGMDPDQAMEVYRGAVLALRVRSIGEAAQLEINSKGTGFVRREGVRTAPPIAPNDTPATLMAEPVE
jgi:hypothetical protein